MPKFNLPALLKGYVTA